MKLEVYVLLFSIIFFGIPGIWYINQVIKFWKFCNSKNDNSFSSFAILIKDKEVIAKNKKMVKTFFMIVALFFIFFVLLIVTVGYLKKIGYLT